MPERNFEVCWPDGNVDVCYSPSSIIDQYLNVGQSYALAEFLVQTEKGLNHASERVRETYGYACSSAMGQWQKIQLKAQQFEDYESPIVTIHRIT